MTHSLARANRMGMCALLIGCSDPPQTSSNATATVPPPARAIPIDGSYNGITQLASGAAMSCGTQDTMSLQVKNHSFRYVLNQPQVSWQPQRSFDVVIAPDGSFQVQSGPAYIRGQVSQGHMQGQIVGDVCSYQFEADNSGTW